MLGIVPVVMLLSAALSNLGCGSSEDSKPPSDPSYYKGEMKGKGESSKGGAEL